MCRPRRAEDRAALGPPAGAPRSTSEPVPASRATRFALPGFAVSLKLERPIAPHWVCFDHPTLNQRVLVSSHAGGTSDIATKIDMSPSNPSPLNECHNQYVARQNLHLPKPLIVRPGPSPYFCQNRLPNNCPESRPQNRPAYKISEHAECLLHEGSLLASHDTTGPARP